MHDAAAAEPWERMAEKPSRRARERPGGMRCGSSRMCARCRPWRPVESGSDPEYQEADRARAWRHGTVVARAGEGRLEARALTAGPIRGAKVSRRVEPVPDHGAILGSPADRCQ